MFMLSEAAVCDLIQSSVWQAISMRQVQLQGCMRLSVKNVLGTVKAYASM
jgi:hypothetical protein